uniref:Uncharacterized protein n=1 Tax=Aegilops tauschii subsp. strangulata TaxID=200361 RepID=A0A453JBG7_AEGTS
WPSPTRPPANATTPTSFFSGLFNTKIWFLFGAWRLDLYFFSLVMIMHGCGSLRSCGRCACSPFFDVPVNLSGFCFHFGQRIKNIHLHSIKNPTTCFQLFGNFFKMSELVCTTVMAEIF